MTLLKTIVYTAATFGTFFALWIFAIWVASILEGWTQISHLGQWF